MTRAEWNRKHTLEIEKMRVAEMQRHIDDLRQERAEVEVMIAIVLDRIKDAKRVIYDMEKHAP